MISEYMEENGLFDSDLLIPSKEEMERTLKNISENGKITIEDEIVLWKMKLIHKIIHCKDKKI